MGQSPIPILKLHRGVGAVPRFDLEPSPSQMDLTSDSQSLILPLRIPIALVHGPESEEASSEKKGESHGPSNRLV
jgi:hypothetical protein